MAADGAHDEREAAARGIEDPAEAVVLRPVLDPGCHAALDVLDLHEPQRADRAVADELARVARHRIRGVAVGHGEQAILLAGTRHEVAGLREIVRHRLVADDVEPGVERGRRERVVRVVRRHDRHGVDRVGARLLLREHLLDGAVAPLGREAQGRTGGLRASRDRSRTRRPCSATTRRARRRCDACGRSTSRGPRRRRRACSGRPKRSLSRRSLLAQPVAEKKRKS